MRGQNPECVRFSHFRTLWYLSCFGIFGTYVRNFKISVDENEAWEHLSSEVTHIFDFFHCPIFVKHAISDVDLLQSIGWTRFSYISFLTAIKALCVVCVCVCVWCGCVCVCVVCVVVWVCVCVCGVWCGCVCVVWCVLLWVCVCMWCGCVCVYVWCGVCCDVVCVCVVWCGCVCVVWCVL